MRTMLMLLAMIAGSIDSLVKADEPPSVPGGAEQQVIVNSQTSLTKIIGEGFAGDLAWAHPGELLPKQYQGYTLVSKPENRSKGAWRKPVVLKQSTSQVEMSLNCYRKKEQPAVATKAAAGSATPFHPLKETNYVYKHAKFRDLPAASASHKDRDVFVFRDGDLSFKIESTGGNNDLREQAIAEIADQIWNFHHAQ